MDHQLNYDGSTTKKKLNLGVLKLTLKHKNTQLVQLTLRLFWVTNILFNRKNSPVFVLPFRRHVLMNHWWNIDVLKVCAFTAIKTMVQRKRRIDKENLRKKNVLGKRYKNLSQWNHCWFFHYWISKAVSLSKTAKTLPTDWSHDRCANKP